MPWMSKWSASLRIASRPNDMKQIWLISSLHSISCTSRYLSDHQKHIMLRYFGMILQPLEIQRLYCIGQNCIYLPWYWLLTKNSQHKGRPCVHAFPSFLRNRRSYIEKHRARGVGAKAQRHTGKSRRSEKPYIAHRISYIEKRETWNKKIEPHSASAA